MKTYKNLFNKIYSFQNLHLAYLKARKAKRYKSEILKFGYNLEDNLLRLRKELSNQTYQHGGYKKFIVFDQKKRHIKAAPFRDRVVHHALCNIIEPIFDKGFIYSSYACRKNKGTHRAIKRLEKLRRSCFNCKASKGKIYCLQCDISKYFVSIDHQILLKLIEKNIVDKKVLWLVREILRSSEESPGKGIPLGNLTSQLFANIYLNELDQFVKHKLREKYYVRYMDDFLILNFEKRILHSVKIEIRNFLEEKLILEMHPKKVNIFSVEKNQLVLPYDFSYKQSISFLGYRIFGTHRLLRKASVKKFTRRTKKYQKRLNKDLISRKKFNNSIQSWVAYAQFANSWQLRKNLETKLSINLTTDYV